MKGEEVKLLARPTTAYLLQYDDLGCRACCLYCTQSMYSSAPKEMLSRVSWPVLELENAVDKLTKFKRVCLQTIMKPGFVEEAIDIARLLRREGTPSMSVAITPIPRSYLKELALAGVEYLGVGLDAFTPEIFARVGKPYSWDTYMKFIDEAVEVFGRDHVVVHLIVGLGEDIRTAVNVMSKLARMGARIALFAFTPVKGTPMSNLDRPPMKHYRVLQLARYIIERGYRIEDFLIIGENQEVKFRKGPWIDRAEEAFLTSGCPYCNRPFYNESPRGPIYNYPSHELLVRYEDEWRRFLEEVVS